METEQLTPAESLALIERTREKARRAFGFSEWPLYAIWGVVWILGFGVTQMAEVAPGWPSPAAAGLVWLAGVIGGGAASAALGARTARGIDGASAKIGRRVGAAWAAALVAAPLFALALGLQDHQFGALFVFVVGLMYAAQGAAWGDPLQMGLGFWFLAVDLAALVAGPAWYSLMLAVLGGGGFLVGAYLGWRRGPVG